MNKETKKRILAFLIATGVIGTSTHHIYAAAKEIDKVINTKNSKENSIGYDNISAVKNFKVRDNNFVVLNVGDHDDVETFFQDKKMKYCNENDISLGVIISSDSEKEVDIYNDVEYAKSLIEKYKIDFPVYLDINKIMDNKKLNNEMKSKLIKDFLEKCSANNMYVGIYGTDTNLCEIKNNLGIYEYDCFLVMDSDKVKYDGSYSLCKDLEGNITSKYNLTDTIKKRNLNNKDNFVFDGYQVIKDGDTLESIANKYDISIETLLEFNDLSSEKDLKLNQIIRIPCVINKTINVENTTLTYEKLKTPIFGADISRHNTNINWKKFKKNFEFLILKCSQGMYKDSKFEEHVKNCNMYDIPIGVYCYNDYFEYDFDNINEFIDAQEKQAQYVIKLLKNKNIEYPVYLDIEPYSGQNIRDILPKRYAQKMLNIWKKTMDEYGYIAGIYCNKSTYDYLKECVSDISNDFELWVAGGELYGDESSESDKVYLKDVNPKNASYILRENKEIDMCQFTNVLKCTEGGTGSHNFLDGNVSHYDYSNPKQLNNNESTFEVKFETREFPDRGNIDIVPPVLGASAASALLAYLKLKKQKNKVRSKTR